MTDVFVNESYLVIYSGIGIATLFCQVTSLVILCGYSVALAKVLYPKHKLHIFSNGSLIIQLLNILNAMFSIMRCFWKDSRYITGLGYMISLNVVAVFFLFHIGGKFEIAVKTGYFGKSFIRRYQMVIMTVYPATYLWSIFNYASMFNGLSGRFASLSITWNQIAQPIWWLYVLGTDFWANYVAMKVLILSVSKDSPLTEMNSRSFLRDAQACLKPLQAYRISDKSVDFEKRKEYQYLISLRLTILCFAMDIFFLVCYVIGSFGKYTINPNRYEMQAGMAMIGTCGVYIHMMMACIILRRASATFKSLLNMKASLTIQSLTQMTSLGSTSFSKDPRQQTGDKSG
jgi:hypothetical protein